MMLPMPPFAEPGRWRRQAQTLGLPALPLAAWAMAVPVLVWAAIGDHGWRGPSASHMFGPYSIDLRLEYAVGVVAAVAALAALVALLAGTVRRTFDARGWAVVGLITLAGAIGAGSWRVETAGSGGANIGGGLLFLVSPVLIAGVLVGAVVISASRRVPSARRTARLTTAALLTAPALFAGQMVLAYFDARIGHVAQREYERVQIGDTRSHVRAELGRSGEDTYWFFPPVDPPSTCDYYDQSDASGSAQPLQYQFCFRDGVVISKTASNQIYPQ